MIDGLIERLDSIDPVRVSGVIHRLSGAVAESRGLFAPVGSQCEIHARSGHKISGEVVGFRGEHALVAPSGELRGLAAGDRVEYRGGVANVSVSSKLIGRVVDADGIPIDGGGREIRGSEVPLHRSAENPLQ
ncbi:MAG: flagellum-specific ATP synthase FliI, partial [Planctomycetota bacterium]